MDRALLRGPEGTHMTNMMSARKPTYWILLLPLVLGAGTCGGSLFVMSSKIKDMPRVKVPGQGTVTLSKGDHVGFLESKTVIDGEAIAGVPSVNCTLSDATTGAQIAVEPAGVNTSYGVGSYAGESVLEVTIPKTGDYLVACQGSGAGALAFGQGLAWLIIMAVVAGLLGVAVAGFLWWRIRRKRKAFG